MKEVLSQLENENNRVGNSDKLYMLTVQMYTILYLNIIIKTTNMICALGCLVYQRIAALSVCYAALLVS